MAERVDPEHLADLERIKNFRLMDDDFMTICFDGDIKCTQLVLRIILEMPDLVVLEVHTQVLVANLLDRSVRLDVLARDDQGRRINIEIQREDKGAGSHRARYHASIMDAHLLEKSKDFQDLPEVYVVFITENDVMGLGEPLYHIERSIRESGQPFGDGSHILYVNGAYRGPSDLGRLMHDFSCPKPDEMYFRELADRTRFYKEEKEGVGSMCKALEEMREEAERKGEEKTKKEIIKSLLDQGSLPLEEIAKCVKVSLEDVIRIKTECMA